MLPPTAPAWRARATQTHLICGLFAATSPPSCWTSRWLIDFCSHQVEVAAFVLPYWFNPCFQSPIFTPATFYSQQCVSLCQKIHFISRRQFSLCQINQQLRKPDLWTDQTEDNVGKYKCFTLDPCFFTQFVQKYLPAKYIFGCSPEYQNLPGSLDPTILSRL